MTHPAARCLGRNRLGGTEVVAAFLQPRDPCAFQRVACMGRSTLQLQLAAQFQCRVTCTGRLRLGRTSYLSVCRGGVIRPSAATTSRCWTSEGHTTNCLCVDSCLAAWLCTLLPPGPTTATTRATAGSASAAEPEGVVRLAEKWLLLA